MKKSFDRWQQRTGFSFEEGRKISQGNPFCEYVSRRIDEHQAVTVPPSRGSARNYFCRGNEPTVTQRETNAANVFVRDNRTRDSKIRQNLLSRRRTSASVTTRRKRR